jgi:hypothetical protein
MHAKQLDEAKKECNVYSGCRRLLAGEAKGGVGGNMGQNEKWIHAWFIQKEKSGMGRHEGEGQQRVGTRQCFSCGKRLGEEMALTVCRSICDCDL